MKQKKRQGAQRLRFTSAQRADPALKKPIEQAERAADKRDAAAAKLPTKKKLTVQRTPDAAGKPKLSLSVQEEAYTPGRLRHTAGDAVAAQIRRQMQEDSDDNSAVAATQAFEQTGESTLRTYEQLHHRSQVRRVQNAERAEKRLEQANAKATAAVSKRQQQASSQGNAQGYSNPLSRWQQKRAIRRAYAAAKTTGQTQTIYGAGSQTVAAGRRTAAAARKAPSLFPLIALGMLLLFLLSSLSSCVPLAQTMIHALVISTYPAEESDLLAAERAYTAMEEALADEMEHYERYHPGYDEYRFELDDIWHDPYVLLSIISAYHNGEEWTIDSVYPTLERYFALQYIVTESVTTITQSETGLPYTICTVTLENKDLSHLPIYSLSREQVGMYALYMSTLGNVPELFAGHPHASQLKEPLEYDIPQEVLDADPKFALLMEEANKYIGYPYVWGGDSPETSFDCSGFVSWVYTETGVYHTGRLGATGLWGVCSEVSADEVRPGDLVFFEGTMGADVAGITHVGIYVGNGMMIHCGDPISYADLSRTYWQQHFYAYGRVPY